MLSLGFDKSASLGGEQTRADPLTPDTGLDAIWSTLKIPFFLCDLSQMKGRIEIKIFSIHEILFCLDLLNLTYFMNRILFDFVIWLGRWREGLEFKMLFVIKIEDWILHAAASLLSCLLYFASKAPSRPTRLRRPNDLSSLVYFYSKTSLYETVEIAIRISVITIWHVWVEIHQDRY